MESISQVSPEPANEYYTEHALWNIVPADRKWYRNFVVSSLVLETLKTMDPTIPEPEVDLDGVVVE